MSNIVQELWIPVSFPQKQPTSTTESDPSDVSYRLYAKEVSNQGLVELGDTAAETPNNAKALHIVLIVVHGGPGLADHTELFPAFENFHERFVGAEETPLINTTVLFFDQLGCGKSDQPNVYINIFLYSLEGHVHQLHTVLEFCRARYSASTKICVLGHSWGGQVLLEYLLKQDESEPSGIDAAIVSSAPLDEASYERKQQEPRNALDPEIKAFYEQEEQEMVALAQNAHKRQSQDSEIDSIQSYSAVGAAMYLRLIGTSETNITGEMMGWSVLQRQRLAKCHRSLPPLLLLCTKDDTVPYKDYIELKGSLKGSYGDSTLIVLEVAILEEGGHSPFYGQTAEAYFGYVVRFLLDARII